MKIKGVNIQNEENYYKILSVLKNRGDITSKEVRVLDSFLNGNNTKNKSVESLSENKAMIENNGFSAIRGLAHKETYLFFRIK